MKANKKKIIVLVSMILLLVATGVLNYFLTTKNNDPIGGDDTVTPTFFPQYRLDREVIRGQEIDILDDIIASATSTEEAIATAEGMKLNIVKSMETELILENLIKSKGFEDAIVTISTENVNVVVKKGDLTLEESAQILDIIVKETDYTAADVIITPYV
ncbi:MAG: SpoIIIAH-like family protein [Clostridia bacterium]